MRFFISRNISAVFFDLPCNTIPGNLQGSSDVDRGFGRRPTIIDTHPSAEIERGGVYRSTVIDKHPSAGIDRGIGCRSVYSQLTFTVDRGGVCRTAAVDHHFPAGVDRGLVRLTSIEDM